MSLLRSIFPAAALMVLGPALASQGTWRFRSAPTSPPGGQATLVFDTQRGVTTLHFGVGVPETWTWNGTTWTRRATNGPSNLNDNAFAFDTTRGVGVFVSGQNVVLGVDTWEWDGSSWTNTNARPAPPRRWKHAMAYDAARHVTVLFGGTGSGTTPPTYRDLWLWDGQSWLLRNPVAVPSNRYGHSMAYDSARQRVVLFGGNTRTQNDLPGPTLNDTWEWDGTNWFQIQSPTAPPPRGDAAMAYDSGVGQVILFGGSNGTTIYGDTWAWDGTNWRQLLTTTAPAQRYDAAMAYDSVRGVSVLFSGSTFDEYNFVRDTWEFTSGVPSSYTPFGIGCAGSRGTPRLDARLGSLPIAGRTFFAQVTGLPLTAPAFMFLGFSRTQYGPLPLPFDLAPVGMPGCSLYVSGDFLFPVTNILGSGTWSLDLPASLAGHFYNQALVVDPGANPASLTVSNGADGLIGY